MNTVNDLLKNLSTAGTVLGLPCKSFFLRIRFVLKKKAFLKGEIVDISLINLT